VTVVVYRGPVVGENRRLCYSRRMGRAYPNAAYQAFVKALAWEITFAMPCLRLHGEVEVRAELTLPRGMDHDALTKPICDAIQRSGLIANDHQIRASTMERVGVCAKGETPQVRLEIAAVGGGRV
jgi:Holliday junction resolvase RusA-like endonuclease